MKAHETSTALAACDGGNDNHGRIEGSDYRSDILTIRSAHIHASHGSGQAGVARSAIVLM